MIVFFRNIRDLANKHYRDIFSDHIKQISPYVVCLAEPINASDFPIALLHLFNLELFAYNLRDDVYKI